MSLQEQAPVESGNVVISKSLDYKIQASSVPKYKKHRIYPVSGGLNAQASESGGTELMIEIPAGKAFNLSETVFYGTYNIPAQGVDNYSWLPVDHFPFIRELQLYTRGGVYLCNISNLAKYLKLSQKISTNNKDFLNRSDVNFFYPSNEFTTYATTPRLGDSDSKDLKMTDDGKTYTDITEGIPIYLGGVDEAKNRTAPNVRFDGTPSKINFVEHKYCRRSAKNTALTGTFQLRLGDIPDSIFSIDKDLYFNEVLVLRVTWEGHKNYAWYGTSATNPTTGAHELANPIVFDQLGLYLAVETDEDIVQGLRSKVNSSGLQVLMPYVWYFKNVLSGGTQNISVRFNSAHGMSIAKIMTAPFYGTETLKNSQDHGNVAGDKVQSYYVLVDNTRTTEFDVRCTSDDGKTEYGMDYMLQRDVLVGTPLANYDVFRYNWFILEDFSKDKEVGKDPNTVNGLPLTSKELKIDVTASTTDTSYNWYTFAIAQRRLLIGSQMVEVK